MLFRLHLFVVCFVGIVVVVLVVDVRTFLAFARVPLEFEVSTSRFVLRCTHDARRLLRLAC